VTVTVGSVQIEVELAKDKLNRQVDQLGRQLASIKTPEVEVNLRTARARDSKGRFIKGMPDEVEIGVSPTLNQGEAQKFIGGLRKSIAGGLANVAQGIGQGIGQAITRGVTGAIGATIGTATGEVKESIGLYIDFAKQLTTFGSVANATKDEVKALSNEAKQLGKDTSKTPIQAAEAAVELAKLGFTAKQTTTELAGVISLSEASGLQDLGKAATIAGAGFNVFQRSTKDVADIVAATANATAAGAEDMLQAISEAGGVAKANNQSFETLAITFGLLRSAGFSASVAATGVKTAISRLAAPGTEEAASALREVGVAVLDSEGKLRDMVELIPEFRNALSKIAPDRRAQLVRTIFGDEGGPAFLALLGTSQEKINQTASTIRNFQGAASETSKKLLEGVAGQIELMGGSIETLKLNLGEAFAPAVEGAAKFATDVTNELLKNDELFASLTSEAERFKEFLAENPELVAEMAEGLEEVVSTLAGQAAEGLKSLTQTLADNPQILVDMVNTTGEFIKLLGQAVGLAVDLANKLGGAAEGFSATFGKGGTEGSGSRKAVLNAGGSQKDIEAIEQRVDARLQKEGFAGGNKIFGYNRRLEREFYEEEAGKQLDNLAQQRREKGAKPEGAAKPTATGGRGVSPGSVKPIRTVADPDDDETKTAGANKFSTSFRSREDQAKDAKTKSEKQQREAEKAAEEARRKILANFELTNQQAEAAIEKGESRQLNALKRSQLARGVTVEQAARRELEIEAQTNQKLLESKQKELAEVAKLRAQGTLSAEESGKRELAIQKEIDQLESKSLDNQAARQKLIREQAISAIEDRYAAEDRRFNKAISNLDAEQKRLVEYKQRVADIQRSLAESRGEVGRAFSGLAEARGSVQLSRADRAVSLASRLKDKDLDPRERREIERQLSRAGLGRDEETILKRKAQIEEQIGKQKLAALQQEQQLQRTLMEFDLQRQQFAAKAAEIEARRLVLQQKQALVASQGKLERAQQMEPGRERDRAIAEAMSEREDAVSGLGLAVEGLGIARQQSASLGELAANARTARAASDQSQRIGLLGELANRSDDTALAIARAGGQAGSNPFNSQLQQALNAPVPVFSPEALQSAMSNANAKTEALLGDINENLKAALSEPRSLSVSTATPVEDTLKLLAEAKQR
jgi:TP901 family phage tail tape measure protein